MIDNNELVEKLNSNINKLQSKVEHRILYNARNFVIKLLLKSGIAIDYALPFIIAAIITSNFHSLKTHVPFRRDVITENASIKIIDTSSGIHWEHISYESNYNDELLEHSTGWITNDKGLYERTVTSYRLNDGINLEDTEKILSMTKEEIEQILVITNVRTIKKNILTSEDSIYYSDAIIVTKYLESEEETFTRLETTKENIWYSIWYIALTLCWGYNFRCLEKAFITFHIRDKIREYEPLFRQIDKEELENIRKIIELKQKNLAMINSKSTNIDEKEDYPHRLRKVQRR